VPTPTRQRSKPATAQEKSAAFYSQLRLALAPPADGSDSPQPQRQERIFKTIFQGVGDPEKKKFPESAEDRVPALIVRLPQRLSTKASLSRRTKLAAWAAFLSQTSPGSTISQILLFNDGASGEVFAANLSSYRALLEDLGPSKANLLMPTLRPGDAKIAALVNRRARAYAFAVCQAERLLLLNDLSNELRSAVLDRAITTRTDLPPALLRQLQGRIARDRTHGRAPVAASSSEAPDTWERAEKEWQEEAGRAGADIDHS
jgi:hypothetical protein